MSGSPESNGGPRRPFVRALERTSNFLQLYLHHCGVSEVPKEFHVWACFSLVAACVADRVYFYKFRDRPLYPNLYTVLVGPSGLGKGEAIDTAMKFVAGNGKVNYYEGRATAARLVDHLAKLSKQQDAAHMYLVTPELKMAVGTGALAEDFVLKMTEWYKGRAEIQDGTRTAGNSVIKNLCMNWIAGTTRAWMLESLSRSAVEGGFLGRTLTIELLKYPDKRHRRPTYPEDYDEVYAHLRARVKMLTHTEGEMVLTTAAERVEQEWYENRPRPADESLWPTWKREHDLMLKLAMVLSLMDSSDLVITRSHMLLAQHFSAVAMRAVPSIVRAASVTRDTMHIEVLRDKLFREKTITPHNLRMWASSRMPKDRYTAALSLLRELREIQVARGTTGATVFVWMGGGR